MREFRINDITIGIEELFESMPVAMALIDREGRHVALNQALASFSGRNAKELVGKKVSENSKESAENIKRDFAAFDEGESIPNHELQMGDRVYLVSVKPLRDSAGAAVAEMVVLTDITKNKQTERELAEANRRLDFLASRDPLTGILNARTYYEVCEKLMNAALREKENFSLLFIDIDHFKRINDTYGHDVGDIVLKKVSSCIANTVRSSDVAGRVGGEEFSLYLPNSDLSGALDLAEKLRKTIESLEIKNGKDLLPVTVSIGAASLPFLLLGKMVYIAVTASFISHIFLDLFNRSGVKLFAPLHAKEYISFHTEKLRVRVKSWQEYLILFLIIISCVLVSGETLSMNRVARSITRFFYKHYDGAYSDFKIFSEDICFADVDYFDPVLSKIVKDKFMVLSMFPEKGYFLKCSSSGEPDFSSHNRLIISKDEVSEIELTDSGRKRQQKNISGRSLSELAALPPDCIISGTIKLKNYRPDIKNSDYIRVSHSPTESTITLICAMSGELGEIIELERMRNAELDTLKAKLPSYQIERLTEEKARIENQIRAFNRKGFYSNYKAIIRLNDKIKKIDSRIDSLSMQDSSGADDAITSKISMMESSFAVEWNVWVLEK